MILDMNHIWRIPLKNTPCEPFRKNGQKSSRMQPGKSNRRKKMDMNTINDLRPVLKFFPAGNYVYFVTRTRQSLSQVDGKNRWPLFPGR
jgi:hypothetical protein